MIRVVLVDDHALLREGVRASLALDVHVGVVGEAGSIGEGLAVVEEQRPDVLVLDVQLPDGNGIDACPRFLDLRPGLRVVILTTYGNRDVARRALANGAHGFVVKDSPPHILHLAIETAMGGGRFVDPEVEPGFGLTGRERSALALAAAGRLQEEIADALGVSVSAVKGYLGRARSKLGAETVPQAVGRAVREGLI